MTRVLSGQNLAKLKAFLAQPAADYDMDQNLHAPDPHAKILAWAEDPEHGGLPERSARGFADWLSNGWADWCEEDGTTVEAVLQGAVADWCGGRTF